MLRDDSRFVGISSSALLSAPLVLSKLTKLEGGDFNNLDGILIKDLYKNLDQLVKGFQILNNNNILHCDIKPLNILYKTQYNIIDFGFSGKKNVVKAKTVIDSFDLVAQYLYKEQPNTTLDMSKRISTKEMEEYSDYGVKIYIDLHQMTPEDYNNLQRMNLILQELHRSMSLEFNLSGEYQLGNIKVQVDSLDNITDSLIVAGSYNE